MNSRSSLLFFHPFTSQFESRPASRVVNFDFKGQNQYFESRLMQIGVHISVKGLVQGVGFRYFVYHHASRLGLRGWVRNEYNGDVELAAEGDRSLVEELIKELKVGPRSAHVKDLKIEWQEYQGQYKGFEIH